MKESEYKELIQEKFYDVMSKSAIVQEKNPEIGEVLQDMTELLVLLFERHSEAFKHFDNNIMGLSGDVAQLHQEVQNASSCCGTGTCGTGSTQPATLQGMEQEMSGEMFDLAADIMGGDNDNNGYVQYINNKRKEVKEYVTKGEEVENETQLDADIATLGNFIDKKLR